MKACKRRSALGMASIWTVVGGLVVLYIVFGIFIRRQLATRPAERAEASVSAIYTPHFTAPKTTGMPRVAQAGGEDGPFMGKVARGPAPCLCTTCFDISWASIEATARQSYWEKTIAKRWDVVLDSEVAARFKKSNEERDAVYSTLVGESSLGVGSHVVAIRDPRTQRGRVYLVDVLAVPGAAVGRMKIEFIGEMDTLEAVELDGSFTGRGFAVMRPSYGGFATDAEFHQFLADHQRSLQAIQGWVTALKPGQFGRVFHSVERSGSECWLSCTGLRGAGNDVSKMTIYSWGSQRPAWQGVAAGYASRDAWDFDFESPLGSALTAQRGLARLHKIDGLGPLDANSRYAVKEYIEAYIPILRESSQVYAVVPTGPGSRGMFGLRFQKSGDEWDVIVEGPVGAAGAVDMNGSLEAVAAYRAVRYGVDAEAVRGEWNRRHPASRLTGKGDIAAVRAEIADLLAHGLSTEWFADNYGILLPDPAAATAELRREGAWSPEFRGIHGLEYRDLMMLEMSIGSLGEGLVPKLRGMSFSRCADPMPGASVGGKTMTSERVRHVVIYDFAYKAASYTFSYDGVYASSSTMHIFVHELGHVIGNDSQDAILSRFNGRFLSTDAVGLTAYARSKPETELFSETLAAYCLDGAWLREDRPELYNWMEKMEKSGN